MFLQDLISFLRPARYHFDPSLPNITLPVEISHNGVFTEAKFVLDTGASFTVIDHYLAKALELKPEGKPLEVITASGTSKTSRATLEELTVLGRTQHLAPVLITRLPDDSGISGLLGLSFLKEFNLKINFPNHHLTIS